MELTHPRKVRGARAKPIIGLVGGIGAGKSTVARLLESLGAAVIDSDRLAHEELARPESVARLRKWWGDGILGTDGSVNRRKIAEIVFHDPAELKKLEDFLYPRIHRIREDWVDRYLADPAVTAIVLDAPKLYEAGLGEYCDAVIFVNADWPVRRERVRVTKGWPEAELRNRENLQIPLDDKKAKADYIVVNSSGRDELRREVERVFSEILAAK